MRVIIEKQTAAANSGNFSIATTRPGKTTRYHEGATFRIIGDDLGSGECVKLQYNDGTTWKDAKVDGNEMILSEDTNEATIYGRMVNIRVSKSETTGSIGVEIV